MYTAGDIMTELENTKRSLRETNLENKSLRQKMKEMDKNIQEINQSQRTIEERYEMIFMEMSRTSHI